MVARWRESPGGPQKSRQFERKIDAQHFLTSVEHSKLAGTYVDPAKGKITLKSDAESWFDRMCPTWRASSAVAIETKLRIHVYESRGGRPLGTIGKADVEAWAAALKLSPSTVATIRQHLSQVLSAAVEDGLIPRNPNHGARLPRQDAKRAMPVDDATLKALTRAAPDWFAIAIPLGVGLGLRQAEATGLTVDRVDSLHRTVRIDRQLVTLPGQPPTLEDLERPPYRQRSISRSASHVRLDPALERGIDQGSRGLARPRFARCDVDDVQPSDAR